LREYPTKLLEGGPPENCHSLSPFSKGFCGIGRNSSTARGKTRDTHLQREAQPGGNLWSGRERLKPHPLRKGFSSMYDFRAPLPGKSNFRNFRLHEGLLFRKEITGEILDQSVPRERRNETGWEFLLDSVPTGQPQVGGRSQSGGLPSLFAFRNSSL